MEYLSASIIVIIHLDIVEYLSSTGQLFLIAVYTGPYYIPHKKYMQQRLTNAPRLDSTRCNYIVETWSISTL